MQTLTERINAILEKANVLRDKYLSKYQLASDYLNIYSQTSEEYDFYSEETLKQGQVIKETQSGVYIRINPIVVQDTEISIIKVRKPDQNRKQLGTMNYTSPSYQTIREENLLSSNNFHISVNTLSIEELNIVEEGIDVYITVLSLSALSILERSKKNIGNDSELLAQLEEEKSKRLQLMSDFQNYQRRIEGEKSMFGAMANMGLIREMLEIADDINLALQDETLDLDHAKTSLTSAKDKLVAGVEMAGVQRIDVSVGDEFNKETMEAISTVAGTEEQKGKVVAVISSAYKYKDREGVLKPAKVVVGK